MVPLKEQNVKRAAVVTRLTHGLLYAAVYTKQNENENLILQLILYGMSSMQTLKKKHINA